MSGACDRFLEDLPLYAEGELDAPRARTIRLHLEYCQGCREWIASYDDLTQDILEKEPVEEATRGPVSPEEDPDGLPGEPWELRVIEGGRPGCAPDPAFTNRVMAAIRRAASRRRIARARGIAAAVLVLASLGLGGLAWLGGRHLGPDPFTAAAPFAGPEVLPEADALPPVPSVPSVPAAHGQRADLASSWWVIDPERDQDAEAGREFEAVLYSGDSADPVARDSGESRDFLILKALLGAGPARSGEPRAVPDLLMVPEADGAKGPIPLRPVALPLRIPARDIASTTRIRIRKPAMRYRIVWIDGGAPLHLVPTFGSGESRPPRGSFPLPSPLDERY